MELFNTIVSGVLVYVLGEFILKIFIEPIQSLKKEIEETLNDCTYYANILTLQTFDKSHTEMFDIFRKHSSLLGSKSAIIPFVNFFALLNILPKRSAILRASDNLRGISNTSLAETNDKFLTESRRKVENLLKNDKTMLELFSNLIVFVLLMAGTVQIIKWLVQFIEFLKS